MSAASSIADATQSSEQAVERAARESYGRLLAWLAYQWRDIAAAQDALSTALAKALELWPVQGVPTKPDAWLLSVAKRELLQAARSARLHASPEVQALLQQDSFYEEPPAVPDDRLKLLFICAHPAIDAAIRPALMLQTVLGLDAQVVAQAMLTSPKAMAQRLVRAKQKIRDAGLRFEEPDADELPERLHAVLEAIYAAYSLGWDAVDGADQTDGQMSNLRLEALFLGDVLLGLLPREPEVLGLCALMLFCESRVPARYSSEGAFVPLAEQDTRLWNSKSIAQAEFFLRQAAQMASPGAFQWEAAIQSAHSQRLFKGDTPWEAIVSMHEQLLQLAPSVGGQIALAVATAQIGNLQRANTLLGDLDAERIKTYQPFWVAQSFVARLAGDAALHERSLTMAIGLTSHLATRQYLLQQRGADGAPSSNSSVAA